MNRTCQIRGHKMADTILHLGMRSPEDPDEPYKNYQWICGRCGHSEYVKYGTKPDSFGPRVNAAVNVGPVHIRVTI